MIPGSLIHNCELNDKRVLVYLSILFSGWSGINIEELVTYSKFSTRRDSNGVLQQYKEIVSQLIKEQYFCKIKSELKQIRQSDSFGVVYYSEFQKVLCAREKSIQSGKRINHSQILLILSHIRLSMIRQKNTPLFYSDLLNRISYKTGISIRNIAKALKILEELDIIHSERLPHYKDKDGCWHTNVTIFVNKKTKEEDYDWQKEVIRGIEYITTRKGG